MPNTDDPNDPTVDLSKEVPPPTPIKEQVLAGINALRDEVAALRGELREFKEDTHANFLRIENSFEVIHNDLMRIRTDSVGHEKRLKDLEQERKAS
jgi:hypothetical protein